MTLDRFRRWLGSDADDAAKERLLAEVGGSWVDDAVALERVNRDYAARRPGLKALITEATVRTWAREDPEFAQALKVARQHREEAHRLSPESAERHQLPEPGEQRFIPIEQAAPARRSPFGSAPNPDSFPTPR